MFGRKKKQKELVAKVKKQGTGFLSDFKKFIAPLWQFYNDTPDRLAMTDWYDTVSGTQIGFIHRTVQGGLYIKMLDESKKLYLK